MRSDPSERFTRYNGSSARWQTAVTVQRLPVWSNTKWPGLMCLKVIQPEGVGTGVSLARDAQPPLLDNSQSAVGACAGDRFREVWEGDSGNWLGCGIGLYVLLRFGCECIGVRADANARRPAALRLEPGNKVTDLPGFIPSRPVTEGIFPVDALVCCWLNPRGGCSCSTRLTPPHGSFCVICHMGPAPRDAARMQANNKRRWGWEGGARGAWVR